MKKNLLALSAVVLAIAFSAFTVNKTTAFYLTYTSGDQDEIGNYDPIDETFPDEIDGSSTLAWIRVDAASTSGPTSNEFALQFGALNQHSNAANEPSLDDETEDHIYLEKK